MMESCLECLFFVKLETFHIFILEHDFNSICDLFRVFSNVL